jgi:hypothetical protein
LDFGSTERDIIVTDPNEPKYRLPWRISRLFHAQDLLQIILIIAGVGGAIWTTAVWTANWDRSVRDMDNRVIKMEHSLDEFNKLDLPKKQTLLEYRIDQNDVRRAEDAAARRQFETDVGGRLDKILDTVTRMQIRIGDGPGPIRAR